MIWLLNVLLLIRVLLSVTAQKCDPGHYGILCLLKCGNCLNSTCDDLGRCPHGCKLGYYGNDCKRECGHCLDMESCNRDTGFCLTGCQDGFHGVTCNNRCGFRTFGHRCSSLCHCKSGGCNHVNGTCVTPGCESGWKTKSCSEECDANEYGFDCAYECHCKTAGCSHNGTCNQDGCAAGWRGDFCNQECQDGSYGDKCAFSCGNCGSLRACDKVTGDCYEGCVPGYKSPLCVKVCDNNRYGDNCSRTCGQCIDDGQCNPFNGSCFAGQCQPGWKGPQCLVASGKTLNVYYIVAIVGAIVFVVGIVGTIVAVYMIKKRRHRKPPQKEENQGTGYELVNKEAMYPRRYYAASEAEQEEEQQSYYNAEKQQMYCNQDEDEDDNTTHDNLYEYIEEHPGIQVRNLENVIKQKQKNNVYQQEFQRIPNKFDYPTIAANEPLNKIKNRSMNTLPYDKTRVVLEVLPNKPCSDYINASFIDGIDRPNAYIATQAPRKNTVSDFWRMVWQMNSLGIVMLTKLEENRKSVCEQYWPEVGDTFDVDGIKVTMQSEKKYAFFIIRSIDIVHETVNERRQIKQFHYHGWSEKVLPETSELVLFHRRILKDHKENSGPLIIHCSDGASRTGTFIALDALFKQGKDIGRIDVCKYIQEVRQQRINMIQNLEHYIFLYETLFEAFQRDGIFPLKETKIKALKNTLERGGSIQKKKIVKEFEKLQSTMPSYGPDYYQMSKLPANKKLTRNPRVLPVDKYRVCLKLPVTDRTDYINAIKIPSFTMPLCFLVTSFPLATTVVDFWRMIYDYNSNTIVSLVEIDHIKESKLWWPRSKGTFSSLPFIIKREDKKTVIDDISEEFIAVSYEGSAEIKKIKVFEVTSWSRKHVLPQSLEILLKLIDRLHDWFNSDGTTPLVVMSLDGAVRCGLFCAIFNIVESMKLDEQVDIFEIVRQLKQRRPEFIHNSDQYCFCYDTAKYIAQEGQDYVMESYS